MLCRRPWGQPAAPGVEAAGAVKQVFSAWSLLLSPVVVTSYYTQGSIKVQEAYEKIFEKTPVVPGTGKENQQRELNTLPNPADNR